MEPNPLAQYNPQYADMDSPVSQDAAQQYLQQYQARQRMMQQGMGMQQRNPLWGGQPQQGMQQQMPQMPPSPSGRAQQQGYGFPEISDYNPFNVGLDRTRGVPGRTRFGR